MRRLSLAAARLSISAALAIAPGCSGSIERQDSARGGAEADGGTPRRSDPRDRGELDGLETPDLIDASISPEDAGEPDAAEAAAEDAEKVGCGDGRLQRGEACDDGDSEAGDGCSADCRTVEQDFVCPAPGEDCVPSVQCGDGRVSGREQCDDQNRRQGDGCSRDCELEAGYACPTPGSFCIAAKCGDRILAGDEQCEDGDETPVDGDGCSANCRIEPGFVCVQLGAHCMPTVCNDGAKQGSEPCDDGNRVVGDGCTPWCDVEPDCSAGACRSRCGDGLILPNDAEECDDGNATDGDGCSDTCQVEAGYTCTLEQSALPDRLSVPVTYRDFVALPIDNVTPHPDFEIFTGFDVTSGLVGSTLGSDGKPVYTGICDDAGRPFPIEAPGTGTCPENQQTTTRENFDQWYRDLPAVNVTKVVRMELARDAQSRVYATITHCSSRSTATRRAGSAAGSSAPRMATTTASPRRFVPISSSGRTRRTCRLCVSPGTTTSGCSSIATSQSTSAARTVSASAV